MTGWSKDPPSEAGLYWVRGEFSDPAVAHVGEQGRILWIGSEESSEVHDGYATARLWWPIPLTPPPVQ